MALEYLQLENPENLAFGVFIILCVISFYVFSKFMRNKGTAFVIALAISGLASWQLYRERFYGWEETLVFVLILAVIALFLRILWSFVRSTSTGFGKGLGRYRRRY